MKNTNKKRIVVVGGSGFIGSNLLSVLALKNDYELLSISRSNFLMEKVRALKGDFSDKNFLRRVLHPGDTLVHLACTTVPATSELDKNKDYEQNVLGTKKMLEVCQEKRIDNFIFMSSGGTVYGDYGNKKVSEKDAPNPIGHHGKMKLEIEDTIKKFNKKTGLDFLILRASNPFGRNPKQQRNIQGVIEVLLDRALKNKQITIWGDGEQVRDFLYIKDLIFALESLLKNDIRNTTINVGSGRGRSINEVIKIIETVIGSKMKIKYELSRSFDVPYNVLDINKLKSLTGWEKKYSFEDGIKRLVKAYNL